MTLVTASPPLIALTHGDPSGIGPEIVAKAFLHAHRDEPQLLRGCFVHGDVSVMRRGAAIAAGSQPSIPVAVIGSAAQAVSMPPRCIPVLPLDPQASLLSKDEHSAQYPCAQIAPNSGKISYDSVVAATRLALRGEAAAVVTAPIHKEAWALAGVRYPGHTELLQALASEYSGESDMPVRMMLASDELRTVLVSIHVGLRDALARVTEGNVLQTLRIAHRALHAVLGRAPRLALAGLNPHAGEGGLFGREEIDTINPAARAARAEGIHVTDALPPDTVFMQARGFKRFDAVIAMYHDQGLIPVKYLGVEKGVNVTLGLHDGKGHALIRTSPDHGTAFDIAGRGVADASSFIEAVRQAKALARSS
jgi:4-hydroxythreonine-4-phosphate dehydrogenase